MFDIGIGLLRLSQRLFRERVFTMPFGLARGMKRRFGQGFKPKFTLTAEEKFLAGLDLANKTVFDVGGYVGILTLFFARAVGTDGRVVTFEPNPANFEELRYNVSLNRLGNVALVQIGLGRDAATMLMTVDPIYPSRGTVSPELIEAKIQRKPGSISVEIDSLDHQRDKLCLPVPDFVKIDVEGFEEDVLAGMRRTIERYHPSIFIEIHGILKAAMVNQLRLDGYSLYHVERNLQITADNLPGISNGHVFCVAGTWPLGEA